MSANTKAAITMSLAALIIGGGAYWAVSYYRGRVAGYTESQDAATQEGRILGQGRNQTECFDSVLEKSRTCNELRCAVELGGLLTGCLEVATPLESFCDGIPLGSTKDGYAWADKECQKKMGSATIGCAVLFRAKQEHCKDKVPKKTETALKSL